MKFIGISGTSKTEQASLNNALLQAATELVPDGVSIEKIDIMNLPLYLEKYDADYPAEAKALKEKIRAADAIVIATPEHNRSVPAVLKNFIDWTTRPYPDNAWDRKPVMIMGATGGNLSTYGAQHHLRDMLIHNTAYIMPEPALYVGRAAEKMTDGKFTDEATRQMLTQGLLRLKELAEHLK